jgi:hypothetical protein
VDKYQGTSRWADPAPAQHDISVGIEEAEEVGVRGERPTLDGIERPAWSGELDSDSQFDFSREAIDTTAVDIELDSGSVDSMNTDPRTDVETQRFEGMESIQEPEESVGMLGSLDSVEVIEAEPTLNSIPSVFFEASASELEPLFSDADFTFNTEISAEISDLDDLEESSHEPEFEGFSGADKPEDQKGSQAYVVEIGEISEFEEPTVIDDIPLGFSQIAPSVEIESVDVESSVVEEPTVIDDPTIGFSQTDLSVEIESVEVESSFTPDRDSTEIDLVSDQSSVLVREYSGNFEPVESVLSPAIEKPKGLFKRLIGRAVSWIKRFVGF